MKKIEEYIRRKSHSIVSLEHVNISIEHLSTSSLFRIVVKNNQDPEEDKELWLDYADIDNLMNALCSLYDMEKLIK